MVTSSYFKSATGCFGDEKNNNNKINREFWTRPGPEFPVYFIIIILFITKTPGGRFEI